MDISYYLFLGAVILVLAATFLVIRPRGKDNRKKIPDAYFGAIRVTGRDGRDMLIVRKEDGSFEMVEEEKVRKP